VATMVVLAVAAVLTGAVLAGAVLTGAVLAGAVLAGGLVPAGRAAPAGGAVPAVVVVPAGVAAPGQPEVRAAAELAGAGTPAPGEPVAADATITPAALVPADGRMARRVSVARMAALAAPAEVAGAMPSADIAADHRRTAGTLPARDRAQGPQEVLAVNGERDGTAAATQGGTPGAHLAGDSTGSPRGQDVTATMEPRAAANASTAGRPAPTGVTIAPEVLATGASARTAGRHPDTEAGRVMADLALQAVTENDPAGRPVGTEATDAGSPRKAIVTDGPAPKGSAAMSLAPRAVRTRAAPPIVAGTVTVRRAATATVPRAATANVPRAATATELRAAASGTSGRSDVRPGTVPTGRGVPELSATTSRGRVARLVASGPRASTASAGTCQNALAAPFLTSAPTVAQAPLAAPVRNGAKRAATAKTAGPGRRRSGRTARAARLARVLGGHLAAAEIVRAGPPGRGGRVARLVSATVRVQRRVPGRTATDSTGAALPRPRPPGRESRTASPRTSCPARPRQNSTGCPPTWPFPSGGISWPPSWRATPNRHTGTPTPRVSSPRGSVSCVR